MKISIAIMAHPKRLIHAEALVIQLKDYPFCDISISYDGIDAGSHQEEWDNGKRALLAGVGKGDYHVVIQDDAIIGENFYTNLRGALENVPEQNLVSLYTGTIRPRHHQVSGAVRRAKDKSWLVADTLLWGVGIAIPTKDIEPMLEFVKDQPKLYDSRIGYYYKMHNRRVYYTNPSLVDHNWQLPSLTGHDKHPTKRVAHNFSDDIIEWNSKVEVI